MSRDEIESDKQMLPEGLAIQLGYPSKSMPTMLPQTARTLTLAVPSMGDALLGFALDHCGLITVLNEHMHA